MPTRLQIGALLLLAVVAWVALLAARGVTVGWEYLWPFGSVLALLTLALVVWDRVLWRIHRLHGWFVQRPDLRGTWCARLVSDWRDPHTGEIPEPIECYVAITQTFSRLQLRLMSAESESWLVASHIQESPKGSGYQLLGIYMNQPDAALRGTRSEIHYGAFALDTHGPPQRPTSLAGEYWTDRATKGRMELTGRTTSVYTQFATAVARIGTTGQ